MLTMQRLSADSKDCAKFLRKIIRDNETCRYGEGWGMRASDATEWRLKFDRTIKHGIGEPNEEIEVESDIQIRMPGEREYGMIQSFHDSKPVMVVRPSSLHMNGSTLSVLCKLVADGAKLSITATSGSTSSSHEGLSFYFLEATLPGITYGRVTIGSVTTAKDGRTLCSGAVSIR